MRWTSAMLKPQPSKHELRGIEEGSGFSISSDQIDKIDSSPLMLPCASNCFMPAVVPWTKTMMCGLNFVEGNKFAVLTAFLALLSIACDEIRLLGIGDPLDECLEAVLMCSMMVFCFELMVLCAAKQNYTWSIWFPLDVLALLSCFMEMPWFQRLIFNNDCHMFSASSDHAVRVGGTAAHAIRIARVLRVLRLIRLIKVGKLVCRLLACVEEEAGLQAGLQELLHQLCGKSGSAHQQGHAGEWAELSSALAKELPK